MMSHARSAWWLETKSYAPRKPPPRLASLGNPKKKNCSLLFCFSRGWIFSKMERTFFFLGFCPPSIRAMWRGFNSDSVLRKLFSGEKDFAKPRLISRAEEGSGEESARASLSDFFWQRLWKKETETAKMNLFVYGITKTYNSDKTSSQKYKTAF